MCKIFSTMHETVPDFARQLGMYIICNALNTFPLL